MLDEIIEIYTLANRLESNLTIKIGSAQSKHWSNSNDYYNHNTCALNQATGKDKVFLYFATYALFAKTS